jgi:hypothetical protein
LVGESFVCYSIVIAAKQPVIVRTVADIMKHGPP